jgi:hypothetical protein
MSEQASSRIVVDSENESIDDVSGEDQMTSCRTGARALVFLLSGMLGAVGAGGQHKSTSAQKSAADEQKWMQQCKAGGSGLSDSQCALWVIRKEFVQKADCADHDASIACGSFQELIKADDVDLVLDLARQDHVYACFRPQQDVFLEIYYSDPNDGPWQSGQSASAASSYRAGTANVRYYKSGIATEGISFHDSGKWTRGLNASSSGDAVFRGDNIRIEGSRFEASQMYKNEAKLDIHHTIVLQLSTGRFTEKFEEQPSGEAVDEYSGRCFVLPGATH